MKRRKVIWTWEDPDAQESFAEWVGFANPEQTRNQVDKIEALLALHTPLRVLDVGCGTGQQALEMARRGYFVTGIDVAQQFLAQAMRQAEVERLDIRFRLQRGSELREEKEYDLALAYNHTLGFMSEEELRQHFAKIHSALKLSGRLLLALAGPKIIPGQSDEHVRNWAERNGKFILSDKYVDGEGYRHEHDVMIDTNALEIIEFEEKQKAVSLEGVTSVLRGAGFSRIDCFADIEGSASSSAAFGVFVCTR